MYYLSMRIFLLVLFIVLIVLFSAIVIILPELTTNLIILTLFVSIPLSAVYFFVTDRRKKGKRYFIGSSILLVLVISHIHFMITPHCDYKLAFELGLMCDTYYGFPFPYTDFVNPFGILLPISLAAFGLDTGIVYVILKGVVYGFTKNKRK